MGLLHIQVLMMMPVLSDVTGDVLELVVRGDLDRERMDHHDLRIVAGSGGDLVDSDPGSSLSVHVVVQDLNDNPPVFERQRYFAVVRAEDPRGKEVARVRAIDKDEGQNAKVTYSLNRRQSSEEGGKLFGVEEETGIIRLNRR